MDKTFNVAVIVESLRRDSINRKVANVLIELSPTKQYECYLRHTHRWRTLPRLATVTE